MKTTAYLTVAPKFRNKWNRERGAHVGLDSIKVSKATLKRPDTPGVVVKITLDIPDAAFEPLRPVAEITVGLGDVTVNVAVEPPDAEDT